MMARFAVVDGQTLIVENIIEADPNNPVSLTGKLLIDLTNRDRVDIGDLYDPNTDAFTHPTAGPQPVSIVKVQFLDSNGNPASYVQLDSATQEATVTVDIQLLDPTDGTTLLPISGDYIVPYRSAIDGRQKGTILVSVSNGQGQKLMTFSKFQTGVYKVVASDILDASTMQPISQVVFDPPEVSIAITE